MRDAVRQVDEAHTGITGAPHASPTSGAAASPTTITSSRSWLWPRIDGNERSSSNSVLSYVGITTEIRGSASSNTASYDACARSSRSRRRFSAWSWSSHRSARSLVAALASAISATTTTRSNRCASASSRSSMTPNRRSSADAMRLRTRRTIRAPYSTCAALPGHSGQPSVEGVGIRSSPPAEMCVGAHQHDLAVGKMVCDQCGHAVVTKPLGHDRGVPSSPSRLATTAAYSSLAV